MVGYLKKRTTIGLKRALQQGACARWRCVWRCEGPVIGLVLKCLVVVVSLHGMRIGA